MCIVDWFSTLSIFYEDVHRKHLSECCASGQGHFYSKKIEFFWEVLIDDVLVFLWF